MSPASAAAVAPGPTRAVPVPVGSGRLAGLDVAGKAARLDPLAADGRVAVPPALVLVGGSLDRDAAGAVAALVAARPWADSPAWAGADGGPPRVAVRSAFRAEDGLDTAAAGAFTTVLGVDPRDRAALARAVAEVATSAPDGVRADVLVMAQVPAVVAGVAFTEVGWEDDLVDWTDGLAEGLVSGHVAGERATLARLRRRERPRGGADGWRGRLQVALRDLRRVLGDAPEGATGWDVEWADDGATCWIVQARPVTRPPVRDEAFTVANHKEILPELPSVLMTSVIESARFDLMGFYRRADPTLPVDRPYVETFLGRPYLNLSMMTDVLRALGLPTALLADSMGGEVEVDEPLRPGRIAARWRTYLRLGVAQGLAVPAARRAGDRIRTRAEAVAAAPDGPRFGDVLDAAHDAYVAIVETMTGLATTMAVPVGLLRATGTLAGHATRQRTAANRALDELAPLAEVAVRGDDVEADLATWLDRFGHRGVYESDLARPRYRDDPTPIRAAVAAGRIRPPQRAPWTAAQVLTWPLWAVAAPAMAGREAFRDDAMRAFADVRDALVAAARRAAAGGLLPEPEAVWDCTVEELRDLDRGVAVPAERIAARRAERDALARLRLPDVIHRHDDLDAIAGRVVAGADRWRGVPLVSGRVEGRALVAHEPPAALPEGADPDGTILVARSIDAGWIPILTQVAGVAVAIGGDLSHGSIIVRELGLPAVTNLGESATAVPDGSAVVLDGGAGTLALAEA